MTLLLIAALTVSMFGLSACGSKPQEDPGSAGEAGEEAGDVIMDGGWTVAENPAADLPEEVKTAFDKALEVLTGSYKDVTPIAYLGRQVVAGNNYAVLCRVTYADESVPAGLMVLTVYADLEGNAEILSSEEFSIADYNTGDGSTDADAAEPMTGGWQVPDEITAVEVPDDALAAFNKAMEGFTGNDLTPMALLGTQVVAGTNYAFLCRSKLVTADPVESIQVVIIYEDLEGNTTISEIKTVDLGA